MSSDTFSAFLNSCNHDRPRELVLNDSLEGRTPNEKWALQHFFKLLCSKIGCRLMQRNVNFTNKSGKEKPGKLLWFDGIPDLVLKGFTPFHATDWKGEKEAINDALFSLMQEVTFIGVVPHRLWNTWKNQELIKSLVLLIFPIFDHIRKQCESAEYRALCGCGNDGAKNKELLTLSFKFCNELKGWLRDYWRQKEKTKIRLPPRAHNSKLGWPQILMPQQDFDKLFASSGVQISEPKLVMAPALATRSTAPVFSVGNGGIGTTHFGTPAAPSRSVALPPPGVQIPAALRVVTPIEQTEAFINKKRSQLRSLVDQLSKRLAFPIQVRREGSFSRFFMRGIPILVCSATGAELTGTGAEGIASEQMTRQLSRFGLLPEPLLSMIEADLAWCNPILDAVRPAFQYFLDILVSDKYQALYDDMLPRDRQLELLQAFDEHVTLWCANMWTQRQIIYDQWQCRVPQHIWDQRLFNFTTVKAAEENGLFGMTGTELLQSTGLPYGANGVYLYLRPWDPLARETWIAPTTHAAAIRLSDQFLLATTSSLDVNFAAEVKETVDKNANPSQEEDSIIRAVRARASAPLKGFVDSLARHLGQTVQLSKSTKPNGDVEVKVKFSKVPYQVIGGADSSDSADVSELLAYLSLSKRLNELNLVPKEIVDKLMSDKSWIEPVVKATISVFDFVNYLLNSVIYAQLIQHIGELEEFGPLVGDEALRSLNQFVSSCVKFCADYWKGCRIELPSGHKGIGTTFACGATAVVIPITKQNLAITTQSVASQSSQPPSLGYNGSASLGPTTVTYGVTPPMPVPYPTILAPSNTAHASSSTGWSGSSVPSTPLTSLFSGLQAMLGPSTGYGSPSSSAVQAPLSESPEELIDIVTDSDTDEHSQSAVEESELLRKALELRRRRGEEARQKVKRETEAREKRRARDARDEMRRRRERSRSLSRERSRDSRRESDRHVSSSRRSEETRRSERSDRERRSRDRVTSRRDEHDNWSRFLNAVSRRERSRTPTKESRRDSSHSQRNSSTSSSTPKTDGGVVPTSVNEAVEVPTVPPTAEELALMQIRQEQAQLLALYDQRHKQDDEDEPTALITDEQELIQLQMQALAEMQNESP